MSDLESATDQVPRERSGDEAKRSQVAPPPPPPRLLMAPRHRYSSGDDDENDDEEDDGDAGDDSERASGRDRGGSGGDDHETESRRSPPKSKALPTLDAWLLSSSNGDRRGPDDTQQVEPSPAPSPSQASSVAHTPVGTPSTTPSPKKRKRKSVTVETATMTPSSIVPMEDMDVSVETLRQLALQRGLDISSLSSWERRTDGRLVDSEQHVFKSLRDALRALAFAQTGRVPREDIYFLAILRRQLAQMAMPFRDGPIQVVALGRVIPKELFYSQKKLFPVGFEAIASVQLAKANDAKICLRCRELEWEIVEGNNQKSPIFSVSPSRGDQDVVFRSYVASKAWKKALGHFESLTAEELAPFLEETTAETEYLLSSAGEDGFGLLRRNITRILEGGHQVLQCTEYQFWEERHPVSAEAHGKLRSRLLKELKDTLKGGSSKDDIKHLTSQEIQVTEYGKSPEQIEKDLQRKERERREAEKLSVREAARKLLEIELKAQEDAKEAQRKEREDKRNAVLEAKLEQVRQKEARKEATRREKEEERRMREEEKEMRKFMKDEERRRKVEEKEMHMQRKIDELRERRKMREHQRLILEDGVSTGEDSASRPTASPSKRGADAERYLIEKRRSALLRFVKDEREHRRRQRLLERRRGVDEAVWSRVKADYCRQDERVFLNDVTDSSLSLKTDDVVDVPRGVFARVTAMDALPSELHSDAVFAWDVISTFSDVLQMPFVPPLSVFAGLFVQASADSSSLSGAEKNLADERVAVADRSLASIHTSVLKVLLAEYFPFLQMGTSLDEYLRTRPLNLYTWPELARQVCLLALDVAHPSVDDQVVKALKGSRSSRDDPFLLPLRQRLQERGTKLLAGEMYEAATVDDDETTSVTLTTASRRENASTLASLPAAPSTYYGIVTEESIAELVRVQKVDGSFVVTELLPQNKVESGATTSTSSELTVGVEKVNVGDHVVALNGQPLSNVADLDAFAQLVAATPAPHGLLLSTVPPPVKPPLKHIPTTQSANKLKRCAHVLKILRSKELAGPFNQPVDTELYPDYYTAVPEPMDLGTIQEKMEDDEYENDEDVDTFVDDVNLVWKNCYVYNSLKAEISLMAKKLSAVFDRLMEEWVETDVVRPLISVEEDHCRMCRTNQVRDRLLLCDRCDASYHTFCLSPPLQKVPLGEWYCPRCVADPSFEPDLQKKKADEGERSGGGDQPTVKVVEYTELEKKLLQVFDHLSKEDVSQLTIAERIAVLRVLAELLLETNAVQDLYRSLEEKVNVLRRECGDSLADLLQAWKEFAPPKTTSGNDRAPRFTIDGVDYELTDELLDYLEAKAVAERDGMPIPSLPASASKKNQLDVLSEDDDSSASDADEDDDEIQLFEELGDMYLAASSSSSPSEKQAMADEAVAATCQFCGLEDGIVNGPLQQCKRSPLSHLVTEIDDFEVPPILISDECDDSGGAIEESEGRSSTMTSPPAILQVYELPLTDVPSLRLTKVAHGFGFVSTTTDASASTLYAVNDCIVGDMTRDEIVHALQASKTTPVRLYYSLDGSSHEALRASVSIISFTASRASLGIQLGRNAHDGSFVFVRSLRPRGLAELSNQVFPGDVLYMVDGVATCGRSIEEVESLLHQEDGVSSKALVLVRAPSTQMKRLADIKSWSARAVAAQRTRLGDLLTRVVSQPPPPRTTREFYDVTFQEGPLGLALSLEERVLVKSLNDSPDGTLGQASRSGCIQPGDAIERVNGTGYGSLKDLSQFTSTLVTLPRPVVITFSKEVPVSDHEASVAYMDKRALSRSLDMAAAAGAGLKTLSVSDTTQLASLPLTFEDFGIQRPTIVGMTVTRILCDPKNELGDAIELGDRLVGVNGVATTGLPWDAVSRVLFQIRGPIHLHFAARDRIRTLFTAHDACKRQANTAYSELEYLVPKLETSKRIEAFVQRVIPRTLCLGKCSNAYSYFQFHGDRRQLFAKSSLGQWFVVGTGTSAELRKLLACLDSSRNSRDQAAADRIRVAFDLQVPGDSAATGLLRFLESGSFALSSEVTTGTADSVGGDVDKFDAWLSYLGRKYLIGSFASRQDAEAALKQAEQCVRRDGTHVSSAVVAQQTLTLATPIVKAEMMVRRLFQRRYEHGSMAMDASGRPRRVAISQSVVQALRRGMQGGGSHLGYGSSSGTTSGMAPTTMMMAQQTELLKRKAADAELAMRQRGDAQKRARPLSAQYAPAAPPAQQESPSDATKRQLQPLVDQGRAMLSAWNSYAQAPTPQTTHGLAFSCLTSFEEVKKAATRLLADPSQPIPDAATFVSLHHAYVAGLICAMTAQALTNCQRSPGDSQMIKVIADAFATALLCCIEPSPALRSRAMGGFASAVKQCDRNARAPDLSEPLHHIANFIMQFVQVSRYLATGSFDDLANCRPVVSVDPRAMDMLPAAFLQQIRLLENVRRAYVARRSGSNDSRVAVGSVPARPSSASPGAHRPATTMAAPIPDQFTQVDFGPGPLGIMINYSARAKVVVTEYSNDRGQPGQAQASGKVSIGDEVYAVNGRLVEAIGGMEGFKAFVGSGQRPIRVTFKKTADSRMAMAMPSMRGGGTGSGNGAANGGLRRPSPPPSASSFGYPSSQMNLQQQQQQLQQLQQQQLQQQQQQRQQSLMPTPLATSGMNAQQMLYANGAMPQAMLRSMYPQQQGGPAATQSMQQSFPSMPSFPTTASSANAASGFDMMSSSYDGATNANAMPAPINWQNQQQQQQQQQQNQQQLQPQSLPAFNPQPMMRNEGGAMANPMRTPPQFSRSSASMGFPSPPDVGAMANRPPGAPGPGPGAGPMPMAMPASTAYAAQGGYVAANDPSLPANDANSISYFDANGTTFRSTPDFEIDTTATSASSVAADETSTVEGDGNDSILDMDTEEDSDRHDNDNDDSVDGTHSGSMSQMTTPANSDVENDASDGPAAPRSPNRVLVAAVEQATTTTTSTTLATSAPGKKNAMTKAAGRKPKTKQVVDVDEEDMTLSMARRSARVPRKITTNIGDLYNPELNGSNARSGSGRAAASANAGGASGRDGGGSSRGEVVEPTSGEVGELATELLEEFHATIRSSKSDAVAALPTLYLLRAQLLAIEAAIPREAFRSGRWTRAIRAAWSEMVYASDSASMLLEATLFLETTLENEWLDPFWKSAFLPTARYALSTATIASVAVRLYALDDALTYVRAKRGGGRRKQIRTSGSDQSSPVKAPVTVDLTATATTAQHPNDLVFVSKLPQGTITVADRIVNRILMLQREKTPNVVVHRKAIRELMALTDLTENQIEQWVRAATSHAQQVAIAAITSGALAQPTSVSATRQPTPKRKLGASQQQPSLAVAEDQQRPSRKRKLVVAQPSVSLPCYQMRNASSASSPSPLYRLASPSDRSLRPRLELILATLLKSELAIPFAAPVNPRDVPGYTDIIEQPMDLGTIQQRLARGFYDSRLDQVAHDVDLVWTNCFHFNRLDAEISKSANRLRSIFNRLFDQWIATPAPGTAVAALPSEEACRQCLQTHASDRMLLCDSCDAAYHLFCLTPPLENIPAGDWFCPHCPIQQLTLPIVH